MKLTSTEIFSLVWDKIRDSKLAEAVPTMYADHYPTVGMDDLQGEFLVLTSLSNVIEDIQIATVNVNIYVPDTTPTVSNVEQRYTNRRRLTELTRIAFDSISCYPADERYFFDVSDETILTEQEIPYSFANIKVKLKKF